MGLGLKRSQVFVRDFRLILVDKSYLNVGLVLRPLVKFARHLWK